MRIGLAAFIALLPLASASAEPVEKLTAGGRYQLMELNDRIVRLDTQTATFDLCRLQEGSWACQPTVDRARQMSEEITTLTQRVEALEAALAEERRAREAAVADSERGMLSRFKDYVPGLR